MSLLLKTPSSGILSIMRKLICIVLAYLAGNAAAIVSGVPGLGLGPPLSSKVW